MNSIKKQVQQPKLKVMENRGEHTQVAIVESYMHHEFEDRKDSVNQGWRQKSQG